MFFRVKCGSVITRDDVTFVDVKRNAVEPRGPALATMSIRLQHSAAGAGTAALVRARIISITVRGGNLFCARVDSDGSRRQRRRQMMTYVGRQVRAPCYTSTYDVPRPT